MKNKNYASLLLIILITSSLFSCRKKYDEPPMTVIPEGDIITIAQLEKDHNKLEYFIGSKGAYLDRIYYCPYHPEKGFKGEIKKFKRKSKLRKPDNGMLLKAIKELNIDVKNSFMIGDSLVDFQAAKKTKVKFLLVGKKFKLEKGKNHKNLLEAEVYQTAM